MRILHVVASISEVDGGPGMAALEMCRALEAAGHEPVLATTDFDGPSRRLDIPKGEVTRFRDVNVIAFAMVGSSERRKPAPELEQWLRREIATFDVLHVHGLFAKSTADATQIAREAGVPYVLATVGHAMKPNIALGRAVNWPKQIYLRTVERRAFQGAAAVLFTSQLEKDFSPIIPALRKGGVSQRTAIIPPCLPESAFQERPDREIHSPIRIGFMGRLHPIKGFESWLPLLGRLAEEGLAFELHLAGPPTPWSEKHLETIVKQCGLTKKTVFHPALEGDARWDYLADLDMFLLLSRLENFGLAAAEALACGTPVALAKLVGCSEWAVKKDVGTVLSVTADGAAGILGRVLRNRERLQQQSRNAVALAREYFSHQAVADSLSILYTACTSSDE
ncbi:glycosyltransferase [bacterium]|nr:glycosyltransferase [bacterium]